ncbi:MAG: TetR/AcrR family transcriptional regulator [Oceanicaulis sp.]
MNVRTPQQHRSQQRVRAILDAATDLIRTDGAARLTMRAIAQKAEISMGSIYQYYPNRGAILVALCDRALRENRIAIDQALTPPPASIDALLEACVDLMWSYDRLLSDEPVLRDIWAAYAADKSLRDVEVLDSSTILSLILERSRPLFPDRNLAQARLSISVLFAMCAAAVDLAARQDRERSAQIMKETEVILRAVWPARLHDLSTS